MQVTQLTPAQRRFLKQRAHHLNPLMQMGKEGPTEAFSKALLEQLQAHELVKVKILNNCLAGEPEILGLFERIGVTVVQKVGHIFTVFKQNPEESWFNLPGT